MRLTPPAAGIIILLMDRIRSCLAIVTAWILFAIVLPAPAGGPPDITPILPGLTPYGVVVGRGLVVEVAHIRADPKPGRETFVTFANGVMLKAIVRKVCPQWDLLALEVSDPPEDALPPPFARRLTNPLYVVVGPFNLLGPEFVRATWNGKYSEWLDGRVVHLPEIELSLPKGRVGWSGSPVVNQKGEIAGLVVGGNTTTGYGDDRIIIASVSEIFRCR